MQVIMKREIKLQEKRMFDCSARKKAIARINSPICLNINAFRVRHGC